MMGQTVLKRLLSGLVAVGAAGVLLAGLSGPAQASIMATGTGTDAYRPLLQRADPSTPAVPAYGVKQAR